MTPFSAMPDDDVDEDLEDEDEDLDDEEDDEDEDEDEEDEERWQVAARPQIGGIWLA
jgi:hypothetical protein